MTFAAAQALLLLLPAWLFVFTLGAMRGPPRWLRAVLVTLLVVALARPQWVREAAGSDVVVIVDRSRSMPPRSEATADELIRLLEPQRRPGDRLGVISFGRGAHTELALTAEGHFGGFVAAVDGESSNLSAALDAAADLVPLERQGRVLVLSDGKATGLDARAAARRLMARGIPVDVRVLTRDDPPLDVAVIGLEGASAVHAKEPFLLAATLRSTAPVDASLTLLRNGQPIARTTRALVAGPTVVTFRDLVDRPGMASYELRAEAPGDALRENDLGRAVVRIDGPPRVLLITDKPQGTLAKLLAETGIELEVRRPSPLTLDQLEGVATLVLEDVEAGRLAEHGLRVIAQYVEEAGGGLVLTGGKHSFGEGGYRKSPVEPLLPVSLELREEQRKAAVAMSIIMDCSCSMGVTVPDGRTKMALAAEGVVGALQLLNPRDEASVHMVDTEPHEIFALTPVGGGLPLNRVAAGFSGGGGIFVGVGLETAKEQILRSNKQTRHVLLFSDANDSEEPGTYKSVLADLQAAHVTVSVIGMGSRADSDAKLLEEVARLGKGRIYFAEDVLSLPRIFSQETIAVARSSFIDTPVATTLGPDLAQLGKWSVTTAPRVGGYNLTYLRPQGSVGLRSDDPTKAPLAAWWPHGGGRVAALMAEVDGPFTGELRTWSGQRALITQLVQWTMAGKTGSIDAVPRASLAGNDLHVTLDLDPSSPPASGAATLVLLSGDARIAPLELPMRWEDDDRLGAHFVLPGTGTWHPVVRWGERLFRAAPVTLPWAPEFEPISARTGKDWLLGVAKAGGGVERLAMVGFFQEAVESKGALALAPVLLALAVVLLVVEVFVRRFLSGPRMTRKVAVVAAPSVPRPSMVPISPSVTASSSTASPPSAGNDAAPPSDEPNPPKSEMDDAFSAARARARKRTGR